MSIDPRWTSRISARALAGAAERVSNSVDWCWTSDDQSVRSVLSLERRLLPQPGRDWPGTGTEPSKGLAVLGKKNVDTSQVGCESTQRFPQDAFVLNAPSSSTPLSSSPRPTAAPAPANFESAESVCLWHRPAMRLVPPPAATVDGRIMRPWFRVVCYASSASCYRGNRYRELGCNQSMSIMQSPRPIVMTSFLAKRDYVTFG